VPAARFRPARVLLARLSNARLGRAATTTAAVSATASVAPAAATADAAGVGVLVGALRAMVVVGSLRHRRTSYNGGGGGAGGPLAAEDLSHTIDEAHRVKRSQASVPRFGAVVQAPPHCLIFVTFTTKASLARRSVPTTFQQPTVGKTRPLGWKPLGP
jgi:hypothetical protein